MKDLKFIIILSMLLALSISATNCKKDQKKKENPVEKIKGCKDPESKNYNKDAEVDDGTCVYEAQAVFWFNQSVGNQFLYEKATSFRFYIDGQIAGACSSGNVWKGNTNPECGSDGAMTITKNLGQEKSKTIDYKVVDTRNSQETTIWQGKVILKNKECTNLQLKASDMK